MDHQADGFTLVTRRGGGRRAAAPAVAGDKTSAARNQPDAATAAACDGSIGNTAAAAVPPRRGTRRSRAAAAADAAPPPAALAADIARSCDKLGVLLFAGELRRALRAFLAAARGGGACGCCVDVLALGMGSLSRASSAGAGAASATGVQAATLLLLGKMAAEDGAGCGGCGGGGGVAARVRCFDPAATAADEEVLRALGFAVLSADEAAGASAVRRCGCGCGCAVPLVAFLPHCDAHVYDRLLRGCAADLPRLCLIGNSLAWYHLAGNVAAEPGCEELARFAALAVAEGDAAAAADGGGVRPVETPLPLGDCDAAAERALNATSVHVFRTGTDVEKK